MVTCVVILMYIFFFKQKTAYEMRISDWSSDVCSSDLALPHAREIGMRLHRAVGGEALLSVPYDERLVGDPDSGVLHGGVITALLDTACGSEIGSASCRERVCQYV